MNRAFALIAVAALAASTGCQSLSLLANRGSHQGGHLAGGPSAAAGVDCGECVCEQCQCENCGGQGCGGCCLCRGHCCLCGFCCQVVDPSGVVYNTNPIYAMHQTMRNDASYNFNPGPPVGQTAYPYYTNRGPRDFLLANPPPLGPF